ncbi:yeats-domain-containing protein [Amniculicola lignicola CBS 123094]|uniref:Protein AF-9 homolog n=1 Tax=Amniculicola lignicola CBS 123094 TaxID=1392246 RepID=A0A6A5W2I0_9PLEO|nr:yeats-domain-containing protein [Amniculicola lignicola CBS 123094]
MPAPQANKRVKVRRLSSLDFIGSEAFQLPPHGDPSRPKGIPEDHTKKWTVYVRQPEGDPDLRTWLNKVQFKIFNTYENPLRTCESPPFEVSETGWGGFTIDIRLHFQPLSGEKAQYRQHFLQLENYGTEAQQAQQKASGLVRAEFLEVVQFNEPTEALYEALTAEDQWSYLLLGKGAGGGKKAAMAAMGANGRPKRGFAGGERAAQLPEKGGEDVPYSQEQELQLMQLFKDKIGVVEKELEEEAKKRAETEAKLKALREELGHEAAQQASQQASGDRSRRR